MERGAVGSVVTRKFCMESHTNYAQTCIASVNPPGGSFKPHIEEKTTTAAGLRNPDTVDGLVPGAPRTRPTPHDYRGRPIIDCVPGVRKAGECITPRLFPSRPWRPENRTRF